MPNYKTFAVSLDMKQPTAQRQEWEVVEGDNGNIIEITLTDDGSPVDLTGCKVLAVFGLPTGQTVEQDTDEGSVTISGTNHNIITIALRTGSFSPGKAASGLMKCEIQVYSGLDQDTLITSAQFTFRCRRAIMNDETLPADNNYPILVELIEQIEAFTRTSQSDWNELDNTAPGYIRNKPTIPAAPKQSDWNEADSGDLGYIKNKPTSMTPTAHASTHAAGGTDEITPADIGAIPTTAVTKIGENILVNAYFPTAINQRGNANYSGQVYGIDYWKGSSTYSYMALSNGELVIGASGGSISDQAGIVQQVIEDPGRFAGKEVTISVLTGGTAAAKPFSLKVHTVDGNYAQHYDGVEISAPASNTVSTATFTLPSSILSMELHIYAGAEFSNGDRIYLKAVKMELGDKQTLAGPDDVLEIPDMQTELLKCMRWYQRYSAYITSGYLSATQTSYRMPIYLGAPIHDSPTFEATGWIGRKASGGYSDLTPNETPVAFKNIQVIKYNPTHYLLKDERTTASSDTNNSMLAFVINNLTIKYEP